MMEMKISNKQKSDENVQLGNTDFKKMKMKDR